MKICKNCFREFDEKETDSLDPMEELVRIFQEQTREVNINDYCYECRKELGMLNIAGFDN